MSSTCRGFILLWICVAINYVFGVQEDYTKNVVLYETVSWQDRTMYSEFIRINKSSTIRFNLFNTNNSISFIIFQVHSHIYNVTIYNNNEFKDAFVEGTNIGLYSSEKFQIDTFYVSNPYDFNLKLYVAVLGYTAEDPIPGGCNMEFSVPISPFMKTYFERDFIFVDAAAAKYYSDDKCMLLQNVSVEFYMMYLPEKNLNADTYFEGIKKMLTLDKIQKNAEKIPKTSWNMRRMLSAYPGTGTVYVAVATDTNNALYYSVYVPIHNYACNLSDGDDCEILDDFLSKFICATFLFVGVFVCYFGHRFFKTEMFLFGMLSGGMITFIIISSLTDFDHRPAITTAAVISGFFFGAIWLIFWWFYGIPVIAVSLPALNLGFLVASIIYNKLPGDVVLLQMNFNFWILFILIMLLTSLILVSVAYVSNILCCAVLGAYAVIYPIDFYLGSNLKYIIINTVRRATVPKFNLAVLNLPFEWRDILVITLWIGLAVSGFLFQHYHNRDRVPFPPPARSLRPGTPRRRYGTTPDGRTPDSVPPASAPPPYSVSPTPDEYSERSPLLA